MMYHVESKILFSFHNLESPFTLWSRASSRFVRLTYTPLIKELHLLTISLLWGSKKDILFARNKTAACRNYRGIWVIFGYGATHKWLYEKEGNEQEGDVRGKGQNMVITVKCRNVNLYINSKKKS